MLKQFIILFFILFTIKCTKKGQTTSIKCSPGLILNILGNDSIEYEKTSSKDTFSLEGLCPGLEDSCCTVEQSKKMKATFDQNILVFEEYYHLVKTLFIDISNISGEKMEFIINDLVNMKSFEKNIEDPKYIKFVTSYEYIKGNIQAISDRLTTYFLNILDLNAAFLCSVCDAKNHKSFVMFEDELLSLKFNVNDCNTLVRNKRTKDSFLLMMDMGNLFYFFERVVELYEKKLEMNINFPPMEVIHSVLLKIDTCVGTEFLNDQFCKSMCSSIDFHGTVSLFDYNPDVLNFKLILENVLMKNNTILSDDELDEEFERLINKFDFLNFFTQNPEKEAKIYNNLNLVLKQNEGWSLTKYIGNSMNLQEKFDQIWEYDQEEFNREKKSQLSDDFSFENNESIKSGMSIQLKMDIMYNLSLIHI